MWGARKGTATGGFEAFALAQGGTLLRLAFVLTGTQSDAQDLVQATFVRLLRHWERVARADRPVGYARKVLLNEYLGQRRRRWTWEHVVEPDALPALAGHAATDADRGEYDELWRLVQALPSAQRAVVALRYLDDLPDDQIAAALGCSRLTVRSNAARGLATLRRSLTQAPRAEANR